MTSPLNLNTHNSTQLSAASHQAEPGSNNPFVTPPRRMRDLPPHQATQQPNAFDRVYTPLLAPIADEDDDDDISRQSTPTPSEAAPAHCNSLAALTRRSLPARQLTPARQPLLWPTPPGRRTIKEKTMAGVLPWPADLCLSLGANNWLEWSRHVLTSLEMGQLDIYPLGLLNRPNQATDESSYENWCGNDRMVLGYMRSHMFPSESQYIEACTTSAEAFSMLRHRHEKRSGLTVIQIIQRMMQIWFDATTNDTNAMMVIARDLIYRAEMIGPVDYTKLALLFMMMTVRTTHPSVHEALAPDLMDSSLTLQALERRLNYFHELQATQHLEHMAFSTTAYNPPRSAASSVQSSPTSPTLALPAYPPRANICPNCKRSGHSIEFCISPGGKMEGFSPSDAI
jgi:hypothetical protein